MVVLPEDSGPKISQTRPRGMPPTPKAASREIDPVEMTETGTIASFDPRRRIEPLPNCFSIWLSVRSKARARSLSSIRSLIVAGRYNPERGPCRMAIRALPLLLAMALVAAAADKKTPSTAHGENMDVIVTVTLYDDPVLVKELLG